MSEPAPSRGPSRFLSRVTTGLPQESDFWWLWICGLSIYAIRWIEMIAVSIFIYQRTESAFLVAAVSMMRSIPMVLFGVVFGILADRYDRRLCLILVVVTMMASTTALTVLAYHDSLEVWHLAVGSFINGLGWTSDNPTRRIMIGEVLGAERLSVGMSIDIGSNNFTRVAGPIVGGAMFSSIGIFGVFFTLVALYVISLIAAFNVQTRTSPTVAAGSIAAHLTEGFRCIRNNYTVRAVILITIIFNLFGWPLFSLAPVIAQDYLHLAPSQTGVLVSAEGVGAFVGAVLMGIFALRAREGLILVVGCASYPAFLMLFALSPDPYLAALFLFFSGIGIAVFGITQVTLLYAATLSEMRGRLLGILSSFIGISPLGFIHAGLLSDAIGARAAFLMIGCEGVLAILLTWRYWRHIDQPDGPRAPIAP